MHILRLNAVPDFEAHLQERERERKREERKREGGARSGEGTCSRRVAVQK